jgi:hypothetical protein
MDKTRSVGESSEVQALRLASGPVTTGALGGKSDASSA